MSAGYVQLRTPDPSTACTPGYCLMYVREAFGLPARYPDATTAWENSASQHTEQDWPAGVWYPLWFAVEGVPEGHVVLGAPDGTLYSSTNPGTDVPRHHPSVADLMAVYAAAGLPLTYRGWTEDVAGYPVIAPATLTVQSGTVTPLQNEEPDVLNDDQDKTLHSANIRAGMGADEATNSKVIGLQILAAVSALSKQVAAIGTPAAADHCADVDKIVTEIGERLIAAAPAPTP